MKLKSSLRTMNLIAGLFLLHSLLVAHPMDAKPSMIFADGFESGSVEKWNGQADAKVEWETKVLNVAPEAETQLLVNTHFFARGDLGLIELWLTPSLKSFIKVEPDEPQVVTRGQRVDVSLTVSVPPDEIRSFVDGNLHVRSIHRSRRTFPRTLPINLNLREGWSSVEGPEFSFSYPPLLDDVGMAPFIDEQYSPSQYTVALPDSENSGMFFVLATFDTTATAIREVSAKKAFLADNYGTERLPNGNELLDVKPDQPVYSEEFGPFPSACVLADGVGYCLTLSQDLDAALLARISHQLVGPRH